MCLGPVAGILFVESTTKVVSPEVTNYSFSPVAGILFVERRDSNSRYGMDGRYCVWVPLPGFYLLKEGDRTCLYFVIDKFQSRCRDSIC